MRQMIRILVLSSLFCSAAALAMGTPPPPPPAPAQTAAPANASAIKAANAQAAQTNALIDQVSKAQADKDWETAEKVLKKLVAMDPKRWDFAQNLADAQYNQSEYADAVKSYGNAITLATADTDPAAKQALGLMYTNQGNSYLKLKKTNEGVAAFGKAAALSDNPGVAYFNICAILYNQSEDEGALTACDKSIEADPNRADAYFIKGIILADRGQTDANGKFTVPKGTAEALHMYLKLAPTGPHAAEVKQRLALIGDKGP